MDGSPGEGSWGFFRERACRRPRPGQAAANAGQSQGSAGLGRILVHDLAKVSSQ